MIEFSNIQSIIIAILPIATIIVGVAMFMSGGDSRWITTFFVLLLIGGITTILPTLAMNMEKAESSITVESLKGSLCKDSSCNLSEIGCNGVCEKKHCDSGGLLDGWKALGCNIQAYLEDIGISAIKMATDIAEGTFMSINMDTINKLANSGFLFHQVMAIAIYIYPFILGISFVFIIYRAIKGDVIADAQGFIFSIIGDVLFMVIMPYLIYSIYYFFSQVLFSLGANGLTKVFSQFFGSLIISGGLSLIGLLMVIMIIGFIILVIVGIGWQGFSWILITCSPMFMAFQSLFQNVSKNLITLALKYALAPIFAFFCLEVGLMTFSTNPFIGIIIMIYCITYAIKAPQKIAEILGEMSMDQHLGIGKIARDIKRGQEFMRDHVTITQDGTMPREPQAMQNVTGTVVHDTPNLPTHISMGGPGANSLVAPAMPINL